MLAIIMSDKTQNMFTDNDSFVQKSGGWGVRALQESNHFNSFKGTVHVHV